MRNRSYFYIILFISFIFCSCNYGKSPIYQEISMAFNITDNYSILTFCDGKMVFQTIDNPTLLYSLDINTNNETKLGEISDLILNGYSCVGIDGRLYTSVTVAKDNEELTNVLYELDYNCNSIKPLYADQGYSPIVYLYKEPRGILQLKTPRIDSLQATFFELYNTSTSETEVVLSAQEHEIYVIASVFENKLYVLSAFEKPDSNYSFCLKEYEIPSYRVINETNLDSIYSYLIESRIGKMEVFGDYVYFQNYSNMGVIYKISDSSVAVVLERENIEYAGSPQSAFRSDEVLFYIRNSTECFTINYKSGDIHIIEPDLHDGYLIKSVFVDGDKILMVEKQSSENKSVEGKTMLNMCLFDSLINK